MEFCKLNYSPSSQRSAELLFGSISDYELKWGKDIYDFTFEEIEKVLYSLGTTTLRSLQSITSKFKRYVDFAIKRAVSQNEQNYFTGFGAEETVNLILKSKHQFNFYWVNPFSLALNCLYSQSQHIRYSNFIRIRISIF
jgi:hypothetical protein